MAAGSGIAVVPAVVLDHAALGTVVDRHPLPVKLRKNRTHLVWSGDPSSSLQALIELLPKEGAGRRAAR